MLFPNGAVFAVVFISNILVVKLEKPNIIFILADDLGFSDVGFQNNTGKIVTPNIDKLAKEGIILDQLYAMAECSPSRVALLTGYYPYRTWNQNILPPFEPYGIPTSHKLLPQMLKEAGYKTHMLGKWNAGFCNWKYTPTYRGFDTFYGFYNTYQDHITHKSEFLYYDFRNGQDLETNSSGIHSHLLFTDRALGIISEHDTKNPLFLYGAFHLPHFPLEPPYAEYENFYSKEPADRQKYLAMVTALDYTVGLIFQALKDRNMLDNTVIVFQSDNGGSRNYGASNLPLRGGKWDLYEGGTRVNGLIWGKMLGRTGYREQGKFFITDWFSTLADAAECKLNDTEQPLDSISHWSSLTGGKKLSERTEFIYNIDKNGPCETAALRYGDYKLIQGQFAFDHQGSIIDDLTTATSDGGCRKCIDGSGKCSRAAEIRDYALFDVIKDPGETKDIAQDEIIVFSMMLKKLNKYKSEYKSKPAYITTDTSYAENNLKTFPWKPSFYGDILSPGWCDAMESV